MGSAPRCGLLWCSGEAEFDLAHERVPYAGVVLHAVRRAVEVGLAERMQRSAAGGAGRGRLLLGGVDRGLVDGTAHCSEVLPALLG